MPNLGLKDLSNIILSRGVLIFGVFLPQQETIFTFLNKIIVYVCTIDTLDTFWNTDVWTFSGYFEIEIVYLFQRT